MRDAPVAILGGVEALGILFCEEVFSGAVAGAATDFQYSKDTTWETLGQADKLWVQMTTSQVSATPTLKVDLQSSNDGVHWYVKQALFTSVLNNGVPETRFASDLGAVPSGRYVRLKLYMSAGASPSALVSIVVSGRED